MTPREPDRFEEKARELYADGRWQQPTSVEIRFLAAALRQAADEAYAEGWNTAVAELDLASPAAAPAAEKPWCDAAATGQHRKECPGYVPPSEPVAPAQDRLTMTSGEGIPAPVAPSLLPRVLAALESHPGEAEYGLAAELRRYIADVEAGTDLRALLSKLVDHMKAWAASEDGRIPAPFVSDFREAQRVISRTAARSEGET